MRKRPKHEPTGSYFYLARHFAKCIMRLNFHFGPVRTHMTNTQKMNISEMNTQNIPTLHVCSLDDSESKSINMDKTLSHVCSTDKSESETIIDDACSTDDSESKRVHISVNTSDVKYSMNETKDEEPLVTDNSIINVPSYLKIFECRKNLLNNIDATNELSFMETSQGNGIWKSLDMDERAC